MLKRLIARWIRRKERVRIAALHPVQPLLDRPFHELMTDVAPQETAQPPPTWWTNAIEAGTERKGLAPHTRITISLLELPFSTVKLPHAVNDEGVKRGLHEQPVVRAFVTYVGSVVANSLLLYGIRHVPLRDSTSWLYTLIALALIIVALFAVIGRFFARIRLAQLIVGGCMWTVRGGSWGITTIMAPMSCNKTRLAELVDALLKDTLSPLRDRRERLELVVKPACDLIRHLKGTQTKEAARPPDNHPQLVLLRECEEAVMPMKAPLRQLSDLEDEANRALTAYKELLEHRFLGGDTAQKLGPVEGLQRKREEAAREHLQACITELEQATFAAETSFKGFDGLMTAEEVADLEQELRKVMKQ